MTYDPHRQLGFAALAGLGRYTTRGLGVTTIDSSAAPRSTAASGPRKPLRSVHDAHQYK